ncbi:hypothetical protein BC628DRAFT_1422582 [Trametes gibbosa]|nr:hypothetical protein BC628DRAFT_1422582 [Trametes gibbosa]
MASSPAAPQQINVTDLDVPQLADVRRQLEEPQPQSAHALTRPRPPPQELTHLSNSYAQLRQAQAKFRACIDNVAQVKAENREKTILVPLTNSLYIPGRLNDTEHVIVDVGTGYYVKKALKHYEAKVEFIRTNLEALQETIQKKQENMNYLINVLQMKLQQQQQQQAGGKEVKVG